MKETLHERIMSEFLSYYSHIQFVLYAYLYTFIDNHVRNSILTERCGLARPFQLSYTWLCPLGSLEPTKLEYTSQIVIIIRSYAQTVIVCNCVAVQLAT